MKGSVNEMTNNASSRTQRRVMTKGKTGIKAKKTAYAKRFRGGKNRANRQA
jgi:hypothetical protein